MKIVGRLKKRAKFWAVRRRGGEGVGGRRVKSAQILDAPTKILNSHRTDTPHNTTGDPAQGGKGGPSQGGPWPKKQDMSNKLSRRAAPLAKVLWGQRWFSKVWAHNGLIRKSCLGQEADWAKSGQKKNMEKHQKIPSPKTKNKMKKQK